MRRRQGPTKRLVPTLSPETACPHGYLEEDVIVLEVDCTACQGPSDLSHTKCLSGVMNAMTSGVRPEAIILKRFMHKRYRGQIVDRVSAATAELSALVRTMSASGEPSDKRCRTCPASVHMTVSAMRMMLLADPWTYVSRPEATHARVRERARSCACPNARVCVEKALGSSTIPRRACQ